GHLVRQSLSASSLLFKPLGRRRIGNSRRHKKLVTSEMSSDYTLCFGCGGLTVGRVGPPVPLEYTVLRYVDGLPGLEACIILAQYMNHLAALPVVVPREYFEVWGRIASRHTTSATNSSIHRQRATPFTFVSDTKTLL